MAAAAMTDRIPHEIADEEDGYFNDLDQQPSNKAGDEVPKAKRIACSICRKRKLKCDGARPSCGTCARLSHECSYDEVRKKSGPRRGYVRQLEARLAQVETMLKSGDPKTTPPAGGGAVDEDPMADIDLANSYGHDFPDHTDRLKGPSMAEPNHPAPSNAIMNQGLDEPLPTQDVIDDLNRLYFEKVHPVNPLMHKGRYYAAMRLSPAQQPPVCLRYAMWALTTSVTDKYEDLQDHFYRRARKYIQRDEMYGHGENTITVQHIQAWYLLAMLEFKMTFFPRAWMSTGRAARLAQMMGLHRLDNMGIDVKQCLPPPRDFIDKEERRRTFWLCFCADRFASIGTGWPMSFDENDIHSNLPVDEESFNNGVEKAGIPYSKALQPDGAGQISSMGGVALMACLFGRNLLHLHRGAPDDDERNLNGKFWSRHRGLDNTLLNISLSIPEHLRLPAGISDQNTVFLNLCIHTSTICLHQAAIFKADANRLAPHVAAESKVRCITAAAEIASIMRMISHMDPTNGNPFATFCLYVAARVFVQYLKSRPQDNNVRASLHFLLTAMQAMRRKNLLTESLLVQLDIDLQGAGLEESRSLRNRLAKMDSLKYGCGQIVVQEDGTTKRKEPHAFGDNGISHHTDPRSNSLGGVILGNQGNQRATSVSDSGSSPQPPTIAQDISGVRFSVASRSRPSAPSTRPSPATVSDEAMDFTFDGMDSASPGSFHGLSSRTSTNSQTPPMYHRDSQNSNLTASNATANVNWEAMSNEEFQNMMGQYTNDITTGTTPGPKQNVDQNMDLLNSMSTTDTQFTMPYFDGTDSLFVDGFQESTGLTPAPDGGDLINISDNEWKQIVDTGMLEMGWQGVGAGKKAFDDNGNYVYPKTRGVFR